MFLTEEGCKWQFEQLPLPVKQVLLSIAQEYESACNKHPKWLTDPIHAAAVVAEESGELVRAALQFSFENGKGMEMYKEATQTGAMALRFILNSYITG